MTPKPEEVAAMVRALSLGRVRPNEKAAAALLLAQQERITALRAAAQNDQRRYQWICGRWDECSDESLEEFDRAMNAEDRDAAIDAARQKDGHG